MEEHNAKAWFSLCLAAMVGASVAAASAFWLHKRALDEMLARLDLETVERRKYKNRSISRRRYLDKNIRDSVLGSSNSLPEMSSFANGIDNKPDTKAMSPSMERTDSQPSFAAMSAIPPGLPRVQTCRDGKLTGFDFLVVGLGGTQTASIVQGFRTSFTLSFLEDSGCSVGKVPAN